MTNPRRFRYGFDDVPAYGANTADTADRCSWLRLDLDHFCPGFSATYFPATYTPCFSFLFFSFLGVRGYCMLSGACNPLLCLMHVSLTVTVTVTVNVTVL